jgi:ketosteroid isomerase-like protein
MRNSKSPVGGLLLGVFVAISAPAWAEPAQTTAKSASAPAVDAESGRVEAVVKLLRDAIRTGDASLAERVLAPGVTIYEQGHIESSRAEYMGHHFKEDAAYAKVVGSVVRDTRVKVAGAIAIVTASSHSDGVYQGKPVKSATAETYVLGLQNGVWQIEHIHWSSRKRS